MFGWFSKTKDLKDHLRQTKKLKINGVIFRIKKLNMEDHLAGLNVLYAHYALYQREKDLGLRIQTYAQIRKQLRDFILAGVVEPKLTAKNPPGELIHVDEVLTDQDMATKLAFEIIDFTKGKKKTRLG